MKTTTFLILFLLSTTTLAATPTYLNGRVKRVVDGDTLKLIVGEEIHTIRLYGIDCPEKPKGKREAQPGSLEATAFTREFTAEHEVMVIVRGRDRYGRIVCEVFVDGRSLNRELVRGGHAWWYRKYAKKDFDLKRLEGKAREKGRGVWKEGGAVEPWVWRKRKG